MVTLGEVVTIDRNSVTPENIASGTRYVGLENMDSDGEIHGIQIVDNGELRSNKFQFDSQHILYGKLRPYLRKICRPDFSGICSTDILPIRCGPEMDRNFVYHYLRKQEMVDMATSRCSGANLPRISPKILLTFQIPKPPLEEQKRIATILDKASEISQNTEQAFEKREGLKNSVFIELFGDPLNTSQWQKVSFLDGVQDVTRSQSKIPQKEFLESGVLPIIDQGRQNIGGWTNDPSLACTVPLPNIIFGDHTGVLKFLDFPYALGADGVKVLIPKDENFEPFFLYHLLRFLPMPDVGYSRHYKFLKQFMLICPPIPLQRRFERIVNSINQIPKSMELARENTQSITQEMLT